MTPICQTCRREKAPRGRDVAAAAAGSFCEARECDGYEQDPKPGRYWPGELKPWEDCPQCPCGGPMVTRAKADSGWNHRAHEGDRLVCCACGDGKIGTDAEVEQATRADAAWDDEKKVGRA